MCPVPLSYRPKSHHGSSLPVALIVFWVGSIETILDLPDHPILVEKAPLGQLHRKRPLEFKATFLPDWMGGCWVGMLLSPHLQGQERQNIPFLCFRGCHSLVYNHSIVEKPHSRHNYGAVNFFSKLARIRLRFLVASTSTSAEVGESHAQITGLIGKYLVNHPRSSPSDVVILSQ